MFILLIAYLFNVLWAKHCLDTLGKTEHLFSGFDCTYALVCSFSRYTHGISRPSLRKLSSRSAAAVNLCAAAAAGNDVRVWYSSSVLPRKWGKELKCLLLNGANFYRSLAALPLFLLPPPNSDEIQKTGAKIRLNKQYCHRHGFLTLSRKNLPRFRRS